MKKLFIRLAFISILFTSCKSEPSLDGMIVKGQNGIFYKLHSENKGLDNTYSLEPIDESAVKFIKNN